MNSLFFVSCADYKPQNDKKDESLQEAAEAVENSSR
jgi:hypothetical protein